MPIELSKWYLDCVTPRGEPLIAYVAELRWQAVKLRYCSVLDGNSSRSAQGGNEPVTHGTEISWSNEDLHLSGQWTALDAPIECNLHESAEGTVMWRCLAPRAHATLNIDGRTLTGLGYVEHLRMTIAPWRLPIHRLEWGRFLHDGGYAVWIHWDDRKLHWGDAGIEFLATRTLRDGPLGTTALSSIPLVNQTLPARVLRIHETKWLSRARPHGAVHSDSEGWAIHEVVTWPPE